MEIFRSAWVVPVDRLRWVTFGHVEADECGAMNHFLAAAPNAQVAHGAMACIVQVNDLADRQPRPLGEGEVIDLGGKRVRNIDTPQIPHGWDAHVLFEETTGTLFCGDLFTSMGPSAPLTTDDIIEGALEAEQFYGATALTPTTGPTINRLADLGPALLDQTAKVRHALRKTALPFELGVSHLNLLLPHRPTIRERRKNRATGARRRV